MNYALDYLKKNETTPIYFLSSIFCSFVSAFFLNIIFSNLTFNNSTINDILISTLCLSALCFIVLLTFLIGNYFAVSQFKIIGLFKLSGVSFSAIHKYLFVQYLYISVITSFIGYILGNTTCYVLSNVLIELISYEFKFNTICIQMIINFFVIIFMLFRTTGYMYKYDIVTLIKYNRAADMSSFNFFILGFEIPFWIAYVLFSLILLLISIIPIDLKNFILLGIFANGLFMYKIINVSIYKMFKAIRKRIIYKIDMIICLAHTYNYLRGGCSFIQLLMVGVLLSVCASEYVLSSKLNMFLGISFILVGFIGLFLSLYYRLVATLSMNIYEFFKLKKSGIENKYIIRIIKKELFFTFVIVLFLTSIIGVIIGVRLSLVNIHVLYFLIQFSLGYISGLLYVFIKIYYKAKEKLYFNN